MRLIITTIILANTLPLLVGIMGYTVIFRDFNTPYVLYTFLFWSLASLCFAFINKRAIAQIPEMLRYDLCQIGKQRFFLFVAILMMAINIQWIFSSRDMGLDSRGFAFKIFFLFEDIYFVVFGFVLYRALSQFSTTGLLFLSVLSFPVISIFGRFGIIACSVFALLMLVARYGILTRKMVSRSLVAVVFVVISISYIESNRAADDSDGSRWSAVIDRIGEFATLSLVDDIFSASQHTGFSGFENIPYIWAPSVFFPEKPVINDGSIFLRSEYGLGAGENATRFPIMLHVDSFRRFGWAGLWIAILPAVTFRVMFWLSSALQSKFGVPFLSLVSIKYSLFFYPKSILGLIEIGSYTFFRSAIVFLIITIVYKSLVRHLPKSHV